MSIRWLFRPSVEPTSGCTSHDRSPHHSCLSHGTAASDAACSSKCPANWRSCQVLNRRHPTQPVNKMFMITSSHIFCPPFPTCSYPFPLLALTTKVILVLECSFAVSALKATLVESFAVDGHFLHRVDRLRTRWALLGHFFFIFL